MSKELTQQRLQEILDYDPETGVFTYKNNYHPSKNGKAANKRKTNGYECVWVDNKEYRAHRVAWLYVHGEWPENEIDHINRDKSDNRIENLRDVSASTNAYNRHLSPLNQSGYKGVHWEIGRGKWRAAFGRKLLGRFDDFEDAVIARQQAEKEYWRERV
jgi:hypothetical protein